MARFSTALTEGLRALGYTVDIVGLADEASEHQEPVDNSVSSIAEQLNRCHTAVIQHGYGIYGGTHGDDVLSIIAAVRVPTIAVAHQVLENPDPHQRWVLERLVETTDRVVVMSRAAHERLCRDYGVDRAKVVTIPHGGSPLVGPRPKRPSRPTILTWGLLGPGKGVERVIDAMASLTSVPGRPRYVVAGPTNPAEMSVHGEAYREARVEQARQLGVADSVSFDPRPYSRAMLTDLIQSAAVVVLPYDSTDHVNSAILTEAIANGRPVVATAFPHAVEMLSSGAGIVVDHDDPEALVCALRQVLTQPRLSGAMAAEARRLAPDLAWPTVAHAYGALAQRLAS
ncbi:MAG: glycosyltransferase [Mycobacterium kyogaense]|uniref:glycosyltransferase n=1 Tax=Mycobacterium kyogaense TaxID=2212479 RepID=UPI002FFB433F